jgi:hypothetical protein
VLSGVTDRATYGGMGGASLRAETVTTLPGGLAEFMPGTQLDDQDLVERRPGHLTDAVFTRRAARAPSRAPLGFSP